MNLAAYFVLTCNCGLKASLLELKSYQALHVEYRKEKIMPFCNFQCALFCEQSCGRGASILKMCWDLWKAVWTLVFWCLGFLYQQHKIHMLLQQISFYVGGRTWGILFSILIWLQLLYFVPKFCTLLAPLNLDALCVRRLQFMPINHQRWCFLTQSVDSCLYPLLGADQVSGYIVIDKSLS